MTKFPDWLKDFKAVDPRQTLLRIGKYSQSVQAWRNNPIQVTVYLMTGHKIQGAVITLERDQEGDYLLLASGDEANPTLGFVRLDHVTAVEVPGTTRLREVFTPQPSLALPKEGAPTRLQIKRAIETANQELEKSGIATRLDCNWDSIGDTPEEGFVVNELLSGLRQMLPLIAADASGKEALRPITAVTLRQKQDNYSLEFKREGSVLFLIGNFKQPLRINYQEDLRKLLEAAL